MKKKNLILMGIGAALAAAATIFFINKKKYGQDKKPSGKAPQVKLQNPGEQSEFTTSPSDSELG